MRTTMDKAGRIVVPRAIREEAGLFPGPIDVVADGAAVRIEVPTSDNVVERDGRLFIVGDGPPLTTEEIRTLRLADQR